MPPPETCGVGAPAGQGRRAGDPPPLARALSSRHVGGMTGAREPASDPPDPSARLRPDDGDARPDAPPDEAIRRVLEAHHAALDGGDAAEAAAFVHRPCTVVTRWGAYVLADRGEIVDALTSVQRHLRARGCRRTERRDVRAEPLGDHLARARALSVRYEAEDRELERVATSYVLRRTDRGWRIAVLVEHEAGEGERPAEGTAAD